MMFGLPKSVEIDGKSYSIRSDFRAILDIVTALSDADLTDSDKIVILLSIFYDDEIPENTEEAIKKCFWFISCGDDSFDKERRKTAKVMDWEQDFPVLIGSINSVAGFEVREKDYMHWWTFIGYYMNLGECTFSHIVSIRQKIAKHKKLEKWEKEFYNDNRDKIDIKTRYSEQENSLVDMWTKGVI